MIFWLLLHLLTTCQAQIDGGPPIIFSPIVVIESVIHPGYTLYGSTFGNIYTYPHYNYDGGFNQKWDYIRNGAFFKFQNVQNGYVLYSDEDGYVYSDYRNDEDPRQDWEVNTVAQGLVYIKNRVIGGFLHPGNLVTCISSRDCCCSTVDAQSLIFTPENVWKMSYSD